MTFSLAKNFSAAEVWVPQVSEGCPGRAVSMSCYSDTPLISEQGEVAPVTQEQVCFLKAASICHACAALN